MTHTNHPKAPSFIPVTITFTFLHCFVHFSGDGRYSETVFHDGTRVTALPEDTEEYRAKARLYGYGDDTAALAREHEFLHSFLAERLRNGASHALWAVAHQQQEDIVAPLWEQEEEETQVLAFQQYLNGFPLSVELLTSAGVPVDCAALKAEALSLLRRFPFL